MNVPDWIAERTDKEGRCLLWNRGVNSQGHPVASVDGVRSRAVRRWVYQRLVGNPGTRRIVMTCGNELCLNHKHMRSMTISEISQRVPREMYRNPVRRAKCRAAARSAGKYSLEVARQVRALRAEGKTLEAISEATGMNVSTVSKVCRNERWVEGISAFAL